MSSFSLSLSVKISVFHFQFSCRDLPCSYFFEVVFLISIYLHLVVSFLGLFMYLYIFLSKYLSIYLPFYLCLYLFIYFFSFFITAFAFLACLSLFCFLLTGAEKSKFIYATSMILHLCFPSQPSVLFLCLILFTVCTLPESSPPLLLHSPHSVKSFHTFSLPNSVRRAIQLTFPEEKLTS